MTFADLPAGVSIFLDANPLVYHFAPDPNFGAASSQLLARIVNQEIQAFTSTTCAGRSRSSIDAARSRQLVWLVF